MLATTANEAESSLTPSGTRAMWAHAMSAISTGGSTATGCFSTMPARERSCGSGTSAEEVNLSNPAADTYTVVVQGWGVAGTSPFKLHTWLLGSADAGNMVVSAPAAATPG